MAGTEYSAAATSMSGVDITAVIDSVVVGTLQAISWSITREKAPIYTMGDPNPRSFSRGKRGIAGSMTFITMDRSALWAVMHDKDHYYYAHPLETVGAEGDLNSTSGTATTPSGNGYLQTDSSGNITVDTTINIGTSEGVYNFNNATRDIWSLTSMLTDIVNNGGSIASLKTQAVYYDQIPPFNTILIGQNEAGYAFVSSLIGVEILNLGGGLSVDDITNEEQTTYIARFWDPWRPFSGAGNIGTQSKGNSTIVPDTAVQLSTIKSS